MECTWSQSWCVYLCVWAGITSDSVFSYEQTRSQILTKRPLIQLLWKGFYQKVTQFAQMLKKGDTMTLHLSKGDTMPINIKKRWHIYNMYSILNKKHKYI